MSAYHDVRETREILAITATTLSSMGPLTGRGQAVAEKIAKETRIANLHFAALKQQSLFEVETPPKDMDARVEYAATIQNLLVKVPENEETVDGLDILKADAREIHASAIRERVKTRVNPNHWG